MAVEKKGKAAAKKGKQVARKKEETAAPKKKKAQVEDKEKYVVVIRNVEGNLAHIHQDEIPRFLRLNPAQCRRKLTQASSSSSAAAAEGDAAEKQPWYSVSVREETRTAMVRLGYEPSTAQQLFNVASSEEGKKMRATIKSAADVVKATPKQLFGSTLTLGVRAAGDVTEEGQAQHQKEHTSVEATTTLDVSDRQLSKILHDIPGFMSAWKTASKRYRVIFLNQRTLFAAKTLLDAFEADGIRVSITLPDSVAEAYTEFVETSGE